MIPMKTIMNCLEDMMDTILEDGRIDENEAKIVLEFLEPYCDPGKTKFLDLHRKLKDALEDGKISDGESEDLIEHLKYFRNFLRREVLIETLILWAIGGCIVWGIISAYVK